MNKKFIWVFIFSVLFGGCAKHDDYMKPPINDPSDDANIKLAEAALSISDSMMDVARVEKVMATTTIDNSKNIPNTNALQMRASIDWSGPIAELVDRISSAAHYKLRTLGREPAIPILISMNSKEKSLADILRDVDYQAGNRAEIHVYPNSHTVELRYE